MVLPQRWYVDLGDVVGYVDNKALICVSITMEEVRFFEESFDDGGA